jgi:hypothetical protein
METTNTIDPEGIFGFWKNLALIVIFFTLTPVALGASLFSLYSLSSTQIIHEEIVQKTFNLVESPKSGARVYASLPSEPSSVSAQIEAKDARPEIVKNYLQRYDSPVTNLAGYIVETADKYGLDYRLVTAIAQQESNLCKRIPQDTYNCWGWGVHSKGTLGFNSFEEGIDTVSYGLKSQYIDKGLVTPEQIMSKYVPHSPEGAWAKGVSQFIEEMQ